MALFYNQKNGFPVDRLFIDLFHAYLLNFLYMMPLEL